MNWGFKALTSSIRLFNFFIAGSISSNLNFFASINGGRYCILFAIEASSYGSIFSSTCYPEYSAILKNQPLILRPGHLSWQVVRMPKRQVFQSFSPPREGEEKVGM